MAMVLSGGLFLNCGDDNKKGTDSPTGKVDTSTYKNTVDAAGVQEKGTEAQKIFSSADEKFTAVSKNSFSPLGLVPRSMLLDYDEDKCAAARVPTTTSTADGAVVVVYTCEYTDENAKKISCTITETKSAKETKTAVICDNGTNIETTDEVESDESSTSTSTSTSAASFDYSVLNDFSKGADDCAGAIANVQKFYSNGKTQLESMLAGFKNKDAFASSAGGMFKVEESTDANAAVAYKFSTDPAAKGFTISGAVTAGASDNLIVMTYDMDMAVDFSVVFANLPAEGKTLRGDTAAADPKTMKMAVVTKRRIAADLKKQVIDFDDSGTSTVNDKTFAWKSIVSVEGGDKPAVSVDMTVSGTDPASAKDISTKMQVNITLVDENTLQMTGSGIVDGKSALYSRTVTRSSDGTCKVVNETP
jgi:hypothetical protein